MGAAGGIAGRGLVKPPVLGFQLFGEIQNASKILKRHGDGP
jgi:hypothetical protein